MKKWLQMPMAVTVVVVCCWSMGASVSAQSSTQENGSQKKGSAKKGSAKKEKEEPSFEKKFWKWLEKVEYKESFSPWPGMKDEFMPGESPHGAFLKLYVNRPVVKNPEDPPYKSVIVKENYAVKEKETGKKTAKKEAEEKKPEKKLGAITIMYRMKEGYDPEHDDWYWVKYLPDGTVAKKDGKPIGGRVKSCIQCHANAAGDDYVFTNDK